MGIHAQGLYSRISAGRKLTNLAQQQAGRPARSPDPLVEHESPGSDRSREVQARHSPGTYRNASSPQRRRQAFAAGAGLAPLRLRRCKQSDEINRGKDEMRSRLQKLLGSKR